MKNNLLKRLLAAVICAVTIFSVACTSSAPSATTPPTVPPTTAPAVTENEKTQENPWAEQHPENGTRKIVQETKKWYVSATETKELLVAYYEDTPEILMIDMETVCNALIDDLLKDQGSYTYEETDTILTITRDNGAVCEIDFVDDSLIYHNFDLFNAYHSEYGTDWLSLSYLDSQGNPIYIQRVNSMDIAGLPLYVDLASREIPMDIYEGKKYMPLHTVSDLFFSPYSYNIVYNGKDLFSISGGAMDATLQAEYYSVGASERTQALADFTAKELCLLLDLFYGLADEHGVLIDFSLFLEYTGLWDDLTSTDAKKASAAIASLTMGYLSDLHSAMNMASPYSGSAQVSPSDVEIGTSFSRYMQYANELALVRAKAMPKGVPGYEEIGDTAYVTLDAFTTAFQIRAEDYSEDSAMPVDTMGLIIYAHSMINRENSPIENVVVDLSCNGGGSFDAAVYLVGWMLGYCDIHFTNPVVNSFSTHNYKVDVNLDGKFDSKDSIADKNVYCIISPVSFSCGNMVPALLKESGKVTLIGGTSGGGACAVQFGATADGTIFQFSSPRHLSVVTNGSYYTIDKGVEPHHYLSKMENYYDRAALTDFIKGLM